MIKLVYQSFPANKLTDQKYYRPGTFFYKILLVNVMLHYLLIQNNINKNTYLIHTFLLFIKLLHILMHAYLSIHKHILYQTGPFPHISSSI